MLNNLKALVLIVALSGILLLLGGLFGGTTGLIIALIFAVAMNIGSYWFSDKLALKMTGAKAVSPDEDPQLHRIVDDVVAMAGITKPRVYIIQNDSPNAFATGRNEKHAAIAVTTGIMRILDERELKAVIGHELGHIKNHDILVNAIVATVASAIMFIAMIGRFSLFFGGGRRENILAMIAMIILAPLAATVIRMAISRQREFGADMTGAHIVHDPMALATALQKLQDTSKVRPMQVNPAVSHLFIVNPLGKIDFGSWFASHPPTEKRIERLEKLARTGQA